MKQIIIITYILTYSFTLQAQDNRGTKVLIETDLGEIEVLLYDDTPKHRENFIKLVREGFYNDQLFHRVIKGFMIQGGDPNSKDSDPGEMLGMGGPGYTIPAEIRDHHYHKKGALAAARKGDAVNPEKRSSGSQFYIIQGEILNQAQLNALVDMGRHDEFTDEQIRDYTTVGGSPHLDGGYTVFGEVIKGFNVLDKIAEIPVSKPYNRPLKDIHFRMSIIK